MKMVTKALVLSAAIGAAGLSLPAHAWWGGGPWDNDRYDRSYNDWDWGPFDGWGDGDMSFNASARGSGRGHGRGHGRGRQNYDGYHEGHGYPYGGYGRPYYDRPYYDRPYYENRGYGYPEGYGYPPPPPRYGAPPPGPMPKEKEKDKE